MIKHTVDTTHLFVKFKLEEEVCMSEYRDKLIQDLYDLNVHADITIEELVDDIIDDIKHINGRNYVEMFGDCPMCTDCPDGCSLDK